ncbi:hypothetical protein KIH27_08460 [Mycobacterium sp. M1]|uniref:Membrane protein, MmpS n=1 Tax=Mycolicibacter acidiphilus TaxID=2835306 RepID=A0ABS5RJG0_9MYCO|nr:MmpS family transport accessory protein [Mycolicibacter acidiphilus]MBS9533616.1 hypothetical protein [Mycolicibacter acidiphilus]
MLGVLLGVIVAAGYGVNVVEQMSNDIGSPPSPPSIPPTVVEVNPKNVVYEVFGDIGSGGRVTYADLNSNPIEETLSSLPWSHSETTMSPAATLSLVSQGYGSSLGCRIIVNGEVKDEQFVAHENAAVSCTVIAA